MLVKLEGLQTEYHANDRFLLRRSNSVLLQLQFEAFCICICSSKLHLWFCFWLWFILRRAHLEHSCIVLRCDDHTGILVAPGTRTFMCPPRHRAMCNNNSNFLILKLCVLCSIIMLDCHTSLERP